MLSSQPDDNGSGIGQGDLRDDGRPATRWRTLQVKEQEDASKEVFNAAAFAQLVSGPSGEANRSDSSACIQADHAGTQVMEAHGPR